MEFAFTDDQLAFRDAVRDLLAKECPPEVVRAAYPEPSVDRPGEGPGGGARATGGRRQRSPRPARGATTIDVPADPPASALARVWRSLSHMGVPGLAVPEAAGGLGLSEVDWVLLAEESGYAALPFPLIESVFVAAPLLMAFGYPEAGLGPRVIGGDALVTAELTGAGPVPWVQDSDYALLRVGDRLRMVEHEHLLARATPAPAVDGARDLVTVDRKGLSDVGTVVRAPASAAAAAFDRGVLGTAAQLLGLSRRMLDLTVAYVVERQQFGVPIGSFQAVKHHLADARLRLEFAAPAVYAAAWAMATGQPEAPRDVSVAKALASDAATITARKALQCHGAIGYTVEYDLHLYFKRAFALAASWGDAAWHRDRVGRSLGV